MSKMTSHSLRLAIVNASLEDEGFRQSLENNAQSAITERFGDHGLKVNVFFEKEGELPVLIPTRSQQLEEGLASVVEELGDRAPTRGEFEALIIHKAWNDKAFAKGLEQDARGAIEKALGEYNASLPGDVQVTLYQEKAGECTVVVPMTQDLSELSEEELESVAGGEVVSIGGVVVGAIVGSVAGAIAGKIVDDWWEGKEPAPKDDTPAEQ